MLWLLLSFFKIFLNERIFKNNFLNLFFVMVDLHYYVGFSLVAAGWGRAVAMLHCSAQVSHSRGFSLQRWTPVFAIHGLNS